jgi:hypothetical protein
MAILTVTTTADNGSGSLRQAIANAQSGDVIRFSSSLANQTITLTSGQLVIPAGKNLTIDGTGVTNLSISGNGAFRIFQVSSNYVTPTNVTIQNLNLVNGYTTGRGGAISTEHQAVLTINNVTFQNNVANTGGGAIFSAFEGALTVNNSRFANNQAIAGNDERGAGAIAFWGPGAFTIRNSEFTGNRGINGGAINSLNGKLTIENSRFINNDTLAASLASGQQNPTLRGYGGAVYTDRASSTSEPAGTIRITNTVFEGNRGKAEGGAAYLYTGNQDNVVIQSSLFRNNDVQALGGGNAGNGGGLVVLSNGLNRGLTIDATTFAGNTATSQGGGLWMMGAPTTITNSTFSGNRAVGNTSSKVGGGMTLYDAPVNIINSTIANNYAGWVGGGISANNAAAVGVRNTIFFNNTADNGGNPWNIQKHTNRLLTDLGGNIQFPPGIDANNNATASVRLIDPQLGPLELVNGIWVHRLLPGSPAINTGASGATTVDQLGVARDSRPDVGAYEFGAVLQVSDVVVTEGNSGTTTATFAVSLTTATDQVVTVNYSTVNGTAIAGSDYTATSGSLTFNIGETSKAVSVSVRGDTAIESNETFGLVLSNWVNAGILDGQGVAVIRNDDFPNGIRPKPKSDFNGDGKADLLWRNARTGEATVWTISGNQATGIGNLITVGDLNWKIEATGDFNGDGKADLAWRNYRTGENSIWLMNGAQTIGGGNITPIGDVTWEIEGTGDFNGDGKADLVWRNYRTGENAIWLMNGAQPIGGGNFTTVADANWKIEGVADFNTDGKADLVWRNNRTGENAIWLMNGAQPIGGGNIASVPGANWVIAGVGDFDGNGYSDFLWRDTSSGETIIWQMQGLTAVGGGSLGVVPTNWKVENVADYNGDGTSDIFWRDQVGGANALWFMNDVLQTTSAPGVRDTFLATVNDMAWQASARGFGV